MGPIRRGVSGFVQGSSISARPSKQKRDRTEPSEGFLSQFRVLIAHTGAFRTWSVIFLFLGSSLRDAECKAAGFANAQLGWQFLGAGCAVISRNSAYEQFGGLTPQLVIRKFHSGESRIKNIQPGIIVETYQPKIYGTAQSHFFGCFQQS